MVNRFVAALVSEIELVAPDLKPRTIFFGGGTPSLLTPRQWSSILQKMSQLGLAAPLEWTVECNPATLTPEKASLLKSGGVNRISMGVQSLEESLLDRLGRIHSRKMVFDSYDLLRKAGFQNINLDLMFAIPGQTVEIWRKTLKEIIALQPEHISSYEVTYEEDTPLYHQLQAGEFDVDEALAAEMFEVLVDTLDEAGYEQYEISNFARREASDGLVPARACKHNVNYWLGGDFHGLGPAASEYVRGTRSKNWANTTLYCEELEKGKRAIEFKETLSPIRRAGELAAFGLRMNQGWGFEEFHKITGFELTEWQNEMQQLVDLGYAIRTPERFKLTRLGLRYADWAAELFVRDATTSLLAQ